MSSCRKNSTRHSSDCGVRTSMGAVYIKTRHTSIRNGRNMKFISCEGRACSNMIDWLHEIICSCHSKAASSCLALHRIRAAWLWVYKSCFRACTCCKHQNGGHDQHGDTVRDRKYRKNCRQVSILNAKHQPQGQNSNLAPGKCKSVFIVIFRLKIKRLALCIKGFKVGFFQLLNQEEIRITYNRSHNEDHHDPRQLPKECCYQSHNKAPYSAGGAQDKKVADGFKEANVSLKHQSLQFLHLYTLKYSIFLSLPQIKRSFS